MPVDAKQPFYGLPDWLVRQVAEDLVGIEKEAQQMQRRKAALWSALEEIADRSTDLWSKQKAEVALARDEEQK